MMTKYSPGKPGFAVVIVAKARRKKQMTLTLDYELEYWKQGLSTVVGVDEVGRGSLAGPVVAAAVCFDSGHTPLQGMYDSKRVSVKKRIELNALIHQQARQCVIVSISSHEINARGISAATKHAVTSCLAAFHTIDIALIDGVYTPRTKYACKAIIRGDALCYSIAAASIVAKVYRDEIMKRLSKKHPIYQWDKNMGYGTVFHRIMLRKVGPSPYHRSLFIRKTLTSPFPSNN